MAVTDLGALDSFGDAFPSRESEITEQLSQTYFLLKGAQDHGILDAPVKRLTRDIQPGSKTTAIESIPGLSALNPVRFRVIAEQLWLLGYLENRPDPDISVDIQSTSVFQNAIESFQKEAGLTVDGWSGSQTWKVIKSLVNFESKTEIDRWVAEGGSINPAFKRAVQLRLWAYGLAKRKPDQNFNSIPAGVLKKFKKVLWSLSLIKDYNAKIANRVLFVFLFDPDLLLKAAADFKPIRKPFRKKEDSFSDGIHSSNKHEGIQQIKRRFLVNLAKVELWLLGSDIKIDGEDDYPVNGLIKKSIFGGRDKKIKKFLKEYWEKLSDVESDAIDDKIEAITPSLFQSLVEPETINKKELSPFTQEDYSEKIARDFENPPESDTESLVNRSYQVGKGLGMKLWDGLKRLWSWIKKGVKKILKFGKNMFKAFYRFAMKGYKIVRTAFSAFSKSMDQYIAGLIETDRKRPVFISIDRDMDFQTIINETADSSDLSAAARAVRRFSAMLYFSCKIIGLFIDVLMAVATGLSVGVRLFLALVKGYRSIVPAYRELANVL